jgi:hypothetical protein
MQMQKFLTYSLALLMTVTLMVGCGRGYMRTRTHKAGDRSVTIVKRPKYKGVSGSTTPITTRKYNHLPKK